MKNKRILISGASIAGPALAFWLKRYGFEPTVIERAPSIRPGGYAVDFRGTSLRVLEKMNLLGEIKKFEIRTSTVTIVDKNNQRITNLPDGFTSGELEILRGDLAGILYRTTNSQSEYIFDDSITSIEENGGGVAVKFSREPSRQFDLVVGADGLHSHVRGLVFGEESKFIHHLGYYISIFNVPNMMKLNTEALYYGTLGKRMSLYGTGKTDQCKAGFLFASSPIKYDHRNIEEQKNIIRQHFAQEEWKVPELLEKLKDTQDFYFDSVSQVRMEHYSSGRTVLLGDSAWCASPVTGMGTSLAFIGAYILAGELKEAGGDYTLAYPRYEEQMRPFVQRCHKLADGVQWFCPTTPFKDWLSIWVMRILPHTPWKNFMMELPTRVGSSITLKTY